MNTYSQNSEDRMILEYFNGETGVVLDIGANDGKVLSNSLAVIERGWSAVLVEPAPSALVKLRELHADRILSGQVEVLPVAVAHISGELVLHESGSHLSDNDTALLSTLSAAETKKWKGSTTYIERVVQAVTWAELQTMTSRTAFDLVSIDCEGLDFWILQQMDLTAMGTRFLIVEHNGANQRAYEDLCSVHGLTLTAQNAENLIFAR